MKTKRSLTVFAGGDTTSPLPVIGGPLLGLLYITAFPFIGVATFIFTSGHMIKERLATKGRRETRATSDTQGVTCTEAVGIGAPLEFLINEFKCEFLIVDRELRIVKYFPPLSSQKRLLKQGIIGKHCFEVSHGRNEPCESGDFECPVRRAFETKRIATVTHYHQAQFGRRGKQRLVDVLASPIKDRQDNITHVAELIWDIEKG